ncbi:hypothetical protein EYF80_051824 [Liparis tanakae]|uniref:Uncharacterized protein n=1 Tax=Liparis tanakae TaxID=230148 RepID=A0A4Z2F9Z0_9TELE|nr:hypothetical protein EYF80_051824 [Liparis tanakae]
MHAAQWASFRGPLDAEVVRESMANKEGEREREEREREREREREMTAASWGSGGGVARGTTEALLGQSGRCSGRQRESAINNAECFRGNRLATEGAAPASCVGSEREREREGVMEERERERQVGNVTPVTCGLHGAMRLHNYGECEMAGVRTDLRSDGHTAVCARRATSVMATPQSVNQSRAPASTAFDTERRRRNTG